MRPLWPDLILKVWGGNPLECPCCKGTMKPVRKVIRREEIEFFFRLHGLWEGVIQLARPPPPPFDIKTMKPLWQAIKEWIPNDEPDLDWFNRPRNPNEPAPDGFDQSPAWKPESIQLGDGRKGGNEFWQTGWRLFPRSPLHPAAIKANSTDPSISLRELPPETTAAACLMLFARFATTAALSHESARHVRARDQKPAAPRETRQARFEVTSGKDHSAWVIPGSIPYRIGFSQER